MNVNNLNFHHKMYSRHYSHTFSSLRISLSVAVHQLTKSLKIALHIISRLVATLHSEEEEEHCSEPVWSGGEDNPE